MKEELKQIKKPSETKLWKVANKYKYRTISQGYKTLTIENLLTLP